MKSYLTPNEVHESHAVFDNGWFCSDPRCIKCGTGVYDDDYKKLTVPCIGKQMDLFRNGG